MDKFLDKYEKFATTFVKEYKKLYAKSMPGDISVLEDIEELMEQDHELVQYMKKHNVKIVPAYYHLDSGKVDFLK